MTIKEFKDFFETDTAMSMARLVTFICAVAAFILSIGALVLGWRETLSNEYVWLCIGLWSAAFGGKNWSKNVELKKLNSDGKDRQV